MIYPPNFPPDYGNLAERKVYEALTGLPDEIFDVFFHKNHPTHLWSALW